MNEGEEIEQNTQENHNLQTQQVSSHKRPVSVILLGLLVLLLTGFHLIRFIRALLLWDTLVALPGVPMLYIALTGLLWTIIGIPLLWWLWKGHPRAPRATVIGALAFTIYYWVDRLIVANNWFEHSNFPFIIAVNVILLAFTAWALFNPKSSRYFKVSR